MKTSARLSCKHAHLAQMLLFALSILIAVPATAQHTPSPTAVTKAIEMPPSPAQSHVDAKPTDNVTLSVGSPGVSLLNPNTLLSGVAIANTGTIAAANVTVTSLSLTGGTLISPALPVFLGSIPVDGQAWLHANFSGSFSPGGQYTLGLSGAYTVGGQTFSFTLSQVLTAPPASPGSATANTVPVGSHTITGAPFPHQPLNFGPEVNREGWTVPTGPFVAGTPTPTGTGAQNPGLKLGTTARSIDGSVTFRANNPVGFTSGGSNGTASTVAEPSGASDNRSVLFVTANWVAAYSTDGTTFNYLDPTTIFPNDIVGYCCDQIVHYVPSIDRIVWLLQGNGNRLAVASPADVISSGGTAWTYWNLNPEVFGQPTGTGFDYPDLSVGDNYLYVSWDAGWPGCPTGCSHGRTIARIPLQQLAAGGTINIGYTTPSDSNVAWGGHLSQDTGDEIFWAGHDSNSQIRVFSWAENSNSYFWRSIGLSTWANNALHSTTPDGSDWDSFGFPGNSVIGNTRNSNQLWMAWSAGTDNNFSQDHVEMIELDRSQNFNVLQQVQIWNSGYAFAYPALATNECTGEVGLSLEYGGPNDYENHVVGFWGDFVVYVTSNSNLGTTRYGDYTTIRTLHGIDGASPFFDAFGYGLNTGKIPQTDVRYVQFGRNSCDARKAANPVPQKGTTTKAAMVR